MAFNIEYLDRSGYLHAVVTGTNTPENVLHYMSAIRAECERTDCYRVLIEEKLDGPRFDEMEIFALITEGSPDALGFFEALAYVDEQQDFEVVKFAETVAVNRGIPIATFSSIADAENWIRHRSDDDNGQELFTDSSDAE
jgi:hypothetical protein